MRMFGRHVNMCILINIEIIIMHSFLELYLLELFIIIIALNQSSTEESTRL